MPPNDQAPRYQLVDPSTGDIVGSVFGDGTGNVVIADETDTQTTFDSDGVTTPALEATTSITDPEGNTVTSLSDPVRVTEEASTFAESDVTVTNNNTTVSNGSIELSGSQTSGDALVSFDSGSPADIDSWDLATFQRTLDNETVTVDVITTIFTTIDNFESNDLVVENTDWSDWAGDTANFSAQSTTVIDGSYSGQLTSNGAFTTVNTTNSSGETGTFEGKIRVDSTTGSSGDWAGFSFDSSGAAQVGALQFADNGDIVWFNDNDNILTSWSTGTVYTVQLNFNFDDGTVEPHINGTGYGPYDLRNTSAVDYADVSLHNYTVNSGSSRSGVYFDSIGYEGDKTVAISNASRDEDISSISTDKNVKLRANLSRNDTSNNPTVDYLARRLTR